VLRTVKRMLSDRKPGAQAEQVGVHERLAAGETRPSAPPQRLDIGCMAIQIGRGNLARVGGLPDVAHHAAAVCSGLCG